MQQILKTYLEHLCGKENVKENFSLANATTFRIGGPAKFFVTVTRKDILVRLISTLVFIEEQYFIIGLGANILASDKGYNGTVIKLGFAEIVHNANFVYADAGITTKKLSHFVKNNNLSGLEFTASIPATVGGAVFMNAGAFGSQISDICVCVDVLTTDDNTAQIQTLESTKLEFDYRTSIFQKKSNWIIVGAYFSLKQSTKENIANLEREYRQKRKHHPKEPNAGSTFKRPSPDFFVGKALDELGLKGYRIGDAQISPMHAGFIINKGNATSTEVLELIEFIRTQIYTKHKLTLELEYKLLQDQ